MPLLGSLPELAIAMVAILLFASLSLLLLLICCVFRCALCTVTQTAVEFWKIDQFWVIFEKKFRP